MLTSVTAITLSLLAFYEDFSWNARSMGMANTGLFDTGALLLLSPAALDGLARPELSVTGALPDAALGPGEANYAGFTLANRLSKRVNYGVLAGNRVVGDTSRFRESTIGAAFSLRNGDAVFGLSAKNVARSFADSTAAATRMPRRLSVGLSSLYDLKSAPGTRFGGGLADLNGEGDPPLFWGGASYTANLGDTSAFSEATLGAVGAFRDGKLSVGAGAELWLLGGRVGIRAGLRPSGGNGTDVSAGVSFRTVNVERTDVQLDYAFVTPYRYGADSASGGSHWLGVKVSLGDAQRERKERERLAREEAERAKREQELKDKLAQLKKDKEALEAERNALEEDKAKLLKEKENLEKLREDAMTLLKKVEGLKVEEEDKYIKITADESAIHFTSGTADLRVGGILVLKKISRFLKAYPKYPVEIAGYTDNVPIGPKLKSKYPDNEALSAARAKSVTDYFTLVEGNKAELFTYTGKGEAAPVASNDTEEGRAKNRRVEILIKKRAD